MHDLAFADAVRPARCVILKLLMLPYSIGHELLLFQSRNPLVMHGFETLATEERVSAIISAANICSMTWEQNHFEPKKWREKYLSRRVWKKWDKATRKSDWEAEIKAFRAYREVGSASPHVEPADSATGRDMGAPFHASLIQFLIQKMDVPEIGCYDYALSLAKFHYYTAAESSGDIKIVNENEVNFDAWCKQKDAEALAKKKEVKCPK